MGDWAWIVVGVLVCATFVWANHAVNDDGDYPGG